MVLLLLRHGWTVEHVDKFRLVGGHFVFAEFLFRFLLSVSNDSNGRVREDDRANIVVVHLQIWFAVEKSFGEDSASSDGHRRQLWSASSNVTDGINSWNIRVLELVDFDEAPLVCFDATILKLESLG